MKMLDCAEAVAAKQALSLASLVYFPV